jgi:hypothetical protein
VKGPKSEPGRVSRAQPVQTATRNYTSDDGKPFGFGNQVLIPSHCKLLWPKALVLSVAVKSGQEVLTARSSLDDRTGSGFAGLFKIGEAKMMGRSVYPLR